MAERQQWFGEKTCDICGCEIKGVLYDTKRRDRAPEWATMCSKCYPDYGSFIFWGSGQKYEEDEDGEFYLVAGGMPDDMLRYDEDDEYDDDPAEEDEEEGDEDEDDEQTDDEYDDDPADEDEFDHRSRLLLNEDYHCEQKKVKEQSFQDFLAILHTADTLIRSGICEFSDFARLMVNFHGVRSTLYIKNAYRSIMALPGYDDQKLSASSPEDVDDFDLDKLQPSLCEILM